MTMGMAKPAIVRLCGCGAAAAWVWMCGCAGPAVEVGQTGVKASSTLGTVTATLPAQLPVLTIVAAAESALRAQGLTVLWKTSSEAGGELAAEQRAGGGNGMERVRVWVETLSAGPGLSVRVEPFGDEPRARVMMEAMLVELGMGQRAAANVGP